MSTFDLIRGIYKCMEFLFLCLPPDKWKCSDGGIIECNGSNSAMPSYSNILASAHHQPDYARNHHGSFSIHANPINPIKMDTLA
jgi:hypothetical protein